MPPLLPPAQLPELESDQPTCESPSHQHACLLMVDALLGLMPKVDPGGWVGGWASVHARVCVRPAGSRGKVGHY